MKKDDWGRWGWGRTLTMSALLALAMTTEAASASKTPPLDGTQARVLESMAAAPYQFLLVVEPCHERKCPLMLRLLDHGHLVDAVELPLPAATQNATLQREDGDGWEFMRLLDGKQRFWKVGEEDNMLDVTASLVKFDAHQRGVLVTQKFGQDTLRRAHTLYTVVDQKIVAAWSFRESDGPGWSLAHVVNLAGGNQAVSFWQWRVEMWSEGDPEALPDEARSTLFVWSEAERQVVPQSAPTTGAPLYAVKVGQYAEVGEARKALQAQGNTMCLSDLKPLVLAAERFPDLKTKGFFLGSLLASQSAAERYRSELARCIGASDLKIVPLYEEKSTVVAEEKPAANPEDKPEEKKVEEKKPEDKKIDDEKPEDKKGDEKLENQPESPAVESL